MPDAAAATLQRNRRWLSQVAPSLAVHLDDQSVDAIEFRQRSPEADSVDFDLFLEMSGSLRLAIRLEFSAGSAAQAH